MRAYLSRFIQLTFFFALCSLFFRASAQNSRGLDFLADLQDFRAIERMLPQYLRRLVDEQLGKRRQEIAKLTTPNEIAARKAMIRAQILKSIGGLPERTPLNARVVGSLEREHYRIEKIIFESQPRFFVTANLYLPKQGRGPFPGLLVPLGHELAPKAYPDAQHLLGGLAQKGFAALTWDPIGQGERIQIFDPDYAESRVLRSPTEHSVVGVQCSLVGENLARYAIHDAMRALDYLASRPEVDANRIGCTGNSGGGNVTAYLAALDDRIQVAAPSCWITSWNGLLNTIGPQDSEQTLFPWIGERLDYADFIYAFAPKPYLILAATQDFFSIQGTRDSYQEATGVYAAMGAADKLKMVEADDHHAYSAPRREAAYRWFSRWLKGVEDQTPEPKIDLVSDEELRCTETGQVTTALNSETVLTLVQKRANLFASKRAAPASRTEFSTFQKDIKAKVQRLLSSANPSGPVQTQSYGAVTTPEYRIEKLVFESETGVKIPSLLYLPTGGGGPKPAILYAHGRGKAAEGGSGGDISKLVKAGNIVLSVDLRGMGETLVRESQQSSDTPVFFGDFDSAMIAMLLGKPLVGMRAFDLRRAVDLLSARPEVDRDRISGIGVEAAATAMLFASILDERIKKVALEGMLVSYRSVVNQRIHRRILEQSPNGVLAEFDLPQLAAAIAPRPVWIVNSADPIGRQVDLSEMKREYAVSAAAFKMLGFEGSIRIAKRADSSRDANYYQEWIDAK